MMQTYEAHTSSNSYSGEAVRHDTFDKVRQRTPRKINKKIDQKMRSQVNVVAVQGPAAMRARLIELEKEWDIDKVLMVNFSVLVFAQLVLAMKKDKRWLWGPVIQTPFLLMHATLGWCPPSLWFRPMGFRTRKEIQAEREEILKHLFKREDRARPAVR